MIRLAFRFLPAMLLTLAPWLLAASAVTAESGGSIVALVNDEPISKHDVEMRVKLALASSKDVKEQLQKKLSEEQTQVMWRELLMKHRPKSKEEAQQLQLQLVKRLQGDILAAKTKSMRTEVLKELIDERIQLQQAAKLGVALSDEELDDQLQTIAERNKDPETGKALSRDQFGKTLEKMGIPLSEFRNRMKAKGSWVRVVRRKFQYQVNIGDQDVDRLIAAEDDKSVKLQTVYTVERVNLPVDISASESRKAQVFARAEALRQSVSDCGKLKEAVEKMDGATIKSLGAKSESTFPHTIRAYLSQMSDGQITPPTLTSSGVELYAVCDRKQKRVADLSKRDEVKEKLRAQEFEILARRYLQDLRQEASIEYR